MTLMTINKTSEKNIFDFLTLCNDNFIPPLSQRVDLIDYSHKIFLKAVNFEAWENNRLIGILSAYLNNFHTKTGYITNLCVVRDHMGKGVASLLLNECLNYAGKNNFTTLELEVNKKNAAAINFYNKYNFINHQKKGQTIIMKKNIYE